MCSYCVTPGVLCGTSRLTRLSLCCSTGTGWLSSTTTTVTITAWTWTAAWSSTATAWATRLASSTTAATPTVRCRNGEEGDSAPWKTSVPREKERTSSSEGVRPKNREGNQAVNNPYTVLTLLKRSRVVLVSAGCFGDRIQVCWQIQHGWLSHWDISLPALLVTLGCFPPSIAGFHTPNLCKGWSLGNALKSSICIYMLSFWQFKYFF